MQIKTLIYKGNESKKFTFKRVSALSPYRTIEFHKDEILQIDRDIPGSIAKIAKEEYPAFFEVKEVKMSEEKYLTELIVSLFQKNNINKKQATKIFASVQKMIYSAKESD